MNNNNEPSYEEVMVEMGRVGKLLSQRDRWCQRVYARNKKGRSREWWTQDAYAFCLRGAVMRCYGCDSVGQEVMWLLERAIHAKHDKRVTEWQDSIDRVYEDVFELVKQLGV